MATARRAIGIGMLAALAAGGPARGEPRDGLRLETLRMPEGFRMEVWASGVTGARSMARGARGTLFVGTRTEGVVYALVDADGDGKPDRRHVIARELAMPNGVAFRDGSLYVAEIHRVLRFDGIEERLARPPRPVVVRDDLPRDRHHGWKYVAFGPDGWLYVPVGAPCNVCVRPDPYATIARMRADGSAFEVFARGVRNTVGFDWHPETGHLWFTDNGRDWMGDDRPPDELNHAPRAGMHFGFPYVHGRDLRDPEHPAPQDFRSAPPALELGPHVAALGMRFYRGEMFPERYRGQALIAEHGSWNRTKAIGYRITLARMRDGRAVAYERFVEGWLQDGGPWGRPVDLLELPDGSVLVSDDHAGAIYRLTYAGASPAPAGR